MTNGVLKYEDAVIGEQGCVIKHPLTSHPTIGDMLASTDNSVQTNLEYDATLGQRITASGSWMRFSTITGLDSLLTTGGQYTIKVQAQQGCYDDATSGSIGHNPTGEEISLAFTDGAGSNVISTPVRQAAGNNPIGTITRFPAINSGNPVVSNINTITGQVATSSGSILLHSIGKGDYIEYTTAYIPEGANMRIVSCIDGVSMAYRIEAIADLSTACFANLWTLGRNGTSPLVGFYAKELLVSLEPPVFDDSVTRLFWGDSQVRVATMFGGVHDTTVRDNSPVWQFLRESVANGVHVDPVSVLDPEGLGPQNTGTPTRNPGATVSNTGSNTLKDGTVAASSRANVLALVGAGDEVYFNGSTNDDISGNGSTFPADYQVSLDEHMAALDATGADIYVIGTPSFIGNTTNDTQDSRDNRDGISNPALIATGKPYLETLNLLGAEAPAAFTYLGQFTGGADLHFGPLGGYTVGLSMVSGFVLQGTPTLTTPYPDLSNNVGDTINQNLATNWANPNLLHFKIYQNPDSTEDFTGLPGVAVVAGLAAVKASYQTQVLATDVYTGVSTLSPPFTWDIEKLAVNGIIAQQLSALGGPAIGVVNITAFDEPVTALASGTDLIPRKLYARVTGDVVLIGLDGVEFTHTVTAVGIQDVAFVQINSVGTAGLITDYDGLI